MGRVSLLNRADMVYFEPVQTCDTAVEPSDIGCYECGGVDRETDLIKRFR